MNDRQARAYIRLEQKFHAALASDVLQVRIVGVGRSRGHLVSRYDCHVVVEQLLVAGRHLLARCAINKNRVEYVHFQDAAHHFLHAASATFGHRLAVAGGINALAVEGRARATADAYEVEAQVVFAQ